MNLAHSIEAVLLVSGRPVSVRSLVSVTGGERAEVEAALSSLSARYSRESSGIVLQSVAGGYRLSTSPSCAPVIEKFRREARPSPLSAAAYEVLSCVLYLGAMTRSSISKIRGVNSDAVVRSLLERDLLLEVGRDGDSPGAPALLDLSEDFHIASATSSRGDFEPIENLVSEEELERVRERVLGETTPEVSDPAPGEETL